MAQGFQTVAEIGNVGPTHTSSTNPVTHAVLNFFPRDCFCSGSWDSIPVWGSHTKLWVWLLRRGHVLQSLGRHLSSQPPTSCGECSFHTYQAHAMHQASVGKTIIKSKQNKIIPVLRVDQCLCLDILGTDWDQNDNGNTKVYNWQRNGLRLKEFCEWPI